MQRSLSAILLMFFLISCTNSDENKGCNSALKEESTTCILTSNAPVTGDLSAGTNTDSPSIDVLPTAAYTFDTNVTYVNADATQTAKFDRALDIIKKVIATEEFRRRVLNFTYNGTKQFIDNNGLTNAQIYQVILDGAERLQPVVDNEMDLDVELYYEASSTVGYTYSNVSKIFVNTKFFNSYTPAGVAHNLTHEWLHKLGFKHAATYSVSRDASVPYAVGYIVGEIGKDFL
jgi:hypothetical protein